MKVFIKLYLKSEVVKKSLRLLTIGSIEKSLYESDIL